MKQNYASIGQADTFKNFVDNEEFENCIQSFKTLPNYKTYGKALKDYKNVSSPAEEHFSMKSMHHTDLHQLHTIHLLWVWTDFHACKDPV